MPAAAKPARGLYFCNPTKRDAVYGRVAQATIANLLDLNGNTVLTRENWRSHRDQLRDVQVIVSTWGGPILDEEFLEAAPKLELLLYGAGTVRELMTEAAWARGIRVSSAAAANAEPVADFTVSQILFCLKNGWQLSRLAIAGNDALWGPEKPMPGTFESSVGLVSLGLIGSKVAQKLATFDLHVAVYDPFISAERLLKVAADPMELEELFARCDVVSLHAPASPATRGLIDARLLRSMKRGASLINTARGSLIREDDLAEVLAERPDLTAVLDVTDPEPPAPDSALRRLPNIVLTPHLAGAFNGECRRLGETMVAELRRFLGGKTLQHEIREEDIRLRA